MKTAQDFINLAPEQIKEELCWSIDMGYNLIKTLQEELKKSQAENKVLKKELETIRKERLELLARIGD